MFTLGQEIEINYVTYIVVQSETVSEVEQTHPNTAREMKKRGLIARLVVKKPQGGNLYMLTAFSHRRFTKPFAV